MAAELRVLARQLRRVICSRECDVHSHIVAGVFAQQLLFKAGDECAAAKHERLLFRRAARELLSVRKARVVEHQLVPILRGPVKHRRPPLTLLLQPHQLPVHLFLRDVHVLQLGPQAEILKCHFLFLPVSFVSALSGKSVSTHPIDCRGRCRHRPLQTNAQAHTDLPKNHTKSKYPTAKPLRLGFAEPPPLSGEAHTVALHPRLDR